MKRRSEGAWLVGTSPEPFSVLLHMSNTTGSKTYNYSGFSSLLELNRFGSIFGFVYIFGSIDNWSEWFFRTFPSPELSATKTSMRGCLCPVKSMRSSIECVIGR